MRRTCWMIAALLASAGALPAQEHDHEHAMNASATDSGRTPLYHNLGSYHMAITTRSPVAQQYFDQGLRLTYGFNHDEAIKSYTEGTREDSTRDAEAIESRFRKVWAKSDITLAAR